MSDVSYQRTREQLISLQVDLEEKEKVCQQLQQKIDVERAKLGRCILHVICVLYVLQMEAYSMRCYVGFRCPMP